MATTSRYCRIQRGEGPSTNNDFPMEAAGPWDKDRDGFGFGRRCWCLSGEEHLTR